MKAPILWLFTSIATISPIAYAELEFSGYITSTGDLRFIVTDVESRRTSGWLKIGDTFEGHRVADFDLSDEVLVVEHSGALSRLSLKGSRVKDATPLASKVDIAIAEIMALRFHDDRSKFLRYLRDRGMTLREYRREVEATVRTATAHRPTQKPNKALEPTTTSVTSPAAQEPRQP